MNLQPDNLEASMPTLNPVTGDAAPDPGHNHDLVDVLNDSPRKDAEVCDLGEWVPAGGALPYCPNRFYRVPKDTAPRA